MKYTLPPLLLLLLTVNSYCQQQAPPDLQVLVEDIFSFQDADLKYEELYETLLLYYTDPLPLNKASKDELRSLFILSDNQINSLISYREKYGNLLSIYELQAIPDFDKKTIYKITPFVQVDENGLNDDNRPFIQRVLQEKNNYLLLRYERTLETKKGYGKKQEPHTSSYPGSADNMYARFRINHTRDFSIGFAAEKDAGELLTKDVGTNTYGADFYSIHFQLQNKGHLKNFIVGDYQIQAGQSLLLAAGFNVGKGAESITTARRSGTGIRPYTSIVESGYFRGAAATVGINRNIQLTPFYSRTSDDAVIHYDTISSDNEYISSIQNTGYHRTDAERAAKNQVLRQDYGLNLLFNNNSGNLQLGMTFIRTHLSKPLLLPNQPYNRFRFSGTDNNNIGTSFNYTWHNFSFFGEAGRSKSGGIGAVGGFITSLSPSLETSLVIRSYDRDFHSLYGSAFAESADLNQNEKGIYWGLKYKPSRKYQFTAYFDRFIFPWLRYRVDAPSAGYEYLFRASYQPQRSVLLYAQYRCESKAINSNNEQQPSIKTPSPGIKRNYLIHLSYALNKIVSMKSRIQWSSYKLLNERSQGLLLLQDLNVDIRKFRISTRFALFDTDNYQNRQYAYERDVLFAFSLPPYSGRGTRQYILLQYKLNQHIDFWARYARTHYRDRQSIGTGLEEIEGNIKTDIKLQARIRF